MSEKQQLLLYLIGNYSFLGGVYQLVKTFDRANFPGNVSPDLECLLKEEMIAAEKFVGKHPISYKATAKGLEYLNKEVIVERLIQYVKTFEYPDQLLMALKT